MGAWPEVQRLTPLANDWRRFAAEEKQQTDLLFANNLLHHQQKVFGSSLAVSYTSSYLSEEKM
jgi:hypothetical protein